MENGNLKFQREDARKRSNKSFIQFSDQKVDRCEDQKLYLKTYTELRVKIYVSRPRFTTLGAGNTFARALDTISFHVLINACTQHKCIETLHKPALFEF